jgi:hypothetical protein
MEILKKLPFDLQEHILVKVMKRYKLRDGKYVKQIDKSKYEFLEYIIRPYMNKNSYKSFHCLFNNGGGNGDGEDEDEDRDFFHYKFYIKNLYDHPFRKESRVENDIVEVCIEHKNDIYYYEVSIYKLKMKNIDKNNFTPEKLQKDIYHKGPLTDDYFWDFYVFSYEVK